MEKIEQEFAETNLALKIWCLRGRIFGGWSGNGIQGKIQAAPKPIRSADLVSLPVQMLDYAHRAIFHMPLERHLRPDFRFAQRVLHAARCCNMHSYATGGLCK